MHVKRFLPLYIFLFAFIVRLIFLLATYPGKEQVPYFEDVAIAGNILDGAGYALNFSRIASNVYTRPTAVKPPVYPFLVSLIFFLFGMKNFFALFVAHALLAGFTCSLLFLTIAKFSYKTAIIASLAFAVYPPFIYHSVAKPESTTLLLLLISLFSYELVSLHENFSQKKWVLACFTSGILAMTEPITIPFIFFAFLYIACVTTRSCGKIFAQLLLTIFIFAATVSPWTIRNYLVFKQFVFIKSNFGSFIIESLSHSGVKLPQQIHQSLKKEVEGMDEVSEDRAVKKAMIYWIATNPIVFLQLLPNNFVNYWWETDLYKNDHSKEYIFGRKLPYILLLIFSMPAMLWRLIQLARYTELSIYTNILDNIMLILIFIYTFIYTILGSWLLRYHFPIELAMFIFLAETISHSFNKLPYTHVR